MEKKANLSPQFSNVHTDSMSNLMFIKQQQWTSTNYVVAIFGGVAGISQLKRLPAWTDCLLSVIIVATALYGLYLLTHMQGGLWKFRRRMAEINRMAFTKGELEALELSDKPKPFWYDPQFYVALAGVIIVGALLSLLVVWHSPASAQPSGPLVLPAPQ